MVTRWGTTTTRITIQDDQETLAKMWAAIKKLRLPNQALKANNLTLREWHQEDFHIEEEVLDP